MSTSAVADSCFREAFEAVQAGSAVPSWWQAYRQNGSDAFLKNGLPAPKDEAWRFTDITPIRKAVFNLAGEGAAESSKALADSLAFEGLDPATVAIVNGCFQADLSDLSAMPEGVVVSSLVAAVDEHGQLISDLLGKGMNGFDHAFADLNAGLASDGIFIFVPKNVLIERPIHLQYLMDIDADNLMANPRALIVVEDGAQLTLVESFIGPEGKVYLQNAVHEMFVGENAIVDHYKMQREGHDAFHVGCMDVTLKQYAQFMSHSVAIGGRISRTDMQAHLDGQGIVCTMNGLYLGTDRQLIDNHTYIEHIHPNCESHEIFKGILTDKAHGVFNGKIHVHQEAQKTNALQTNRAMLLSDRATINTKPELLIFADDVKCTHGATIGELDETALFYLRARGIKRDEARAMLTCAFGGEAIDDMKLEPVRETVERIMFDRFKTPGQVDR